MMKTDELTKAWRERMTHLEALKDLKAKVEAGGDVYGFGAVGNPLLRGYAETAYHGSLDAAKALHEALLPGWEYGITRNQEEPIPCAFVAPWGADKYSLLSQVADADTPARAWLLAILSALIAQEEQP
jgi:hypothetical protein